MSDILFVLLNRHKYSSVCVKCVSLLLTAPLPILGLADVEVSKCWLIVYGHLSAWLPVCHVAVCWGDLGLWGQNGRGGGSWKGEERGDSRGTAHRSLSLCIRCCAIKSESSAASVWTAVSSCWTRITVSPARPGPRRDSLLTAEGQGKKTFNREPKVPWKKSFFLKNRFF